MKNTKIHTKQITFFPSSPKMCSNFIMTHMFPAPKTKDKITFLVYISIHFIYDNIYLYFAYIYKMMCLKGDKVYYIV